MTVSAKLSLVLLTGLLFFTALGNHEFAGSTEPRVGGIAMAMHLGGDWIIPRLNGVPFLEKPPLSLWLSAGALSLFGENTWAVRLASALAGLITVLLLAFMLRRWQRPPAIAMAAALMLATTASYWSNVRQVGEDALLTLGVTLALLAFFDATQRQRRPGLLFALGIAIATTSKGVLGLALPGVVIFAWLLSQSLMDKRIVVRAWLWPAGMTLLGLIPLLIWLALLYRQGGGEALRAVLWTNSIGRFDGSFAEAGHFEPFYYYLGKLPEAFLPWNLLVYLGLWHFRKALTARADLMFFTLWLVAQFALLTVASSKRMVYLMALTPAAAVIAAEYGAIVLQRVRPSLRPPLLVTTLALIIGVYMAVAIWIAPRADRTESFLPLTARINQLQAEGRQVVLFTPSERLAGAGVFYSRSLLEALETQTQLDAFLKRSPEHVAVMERADDPPSPLKTLDKIVVGNRAYYLLTY